MIESNWLFLLAGAIVVLLLLAVLLLKNPELRTRVPFYDHFRFLMLYAMKKHPPFPFGQLYRGYFGQGDQDRARAELENRSRKLETDAQGICIMGNSGGKILDSAGCKSDAFLFGVFRRTGSQRL